MEQVPRVLATGVLLAVLTATLAACGSPTTTVSNPGGPTAQPSPSSQPSSSSSSTPLPGMVGDLSAAVLPVSTAGDGKRGTESHKIGGAATFQPGLNCVLGAGEKPGWLQGEWQTFLASDSSLFVTICTYRYSDIAAAQNAFRYVFDWAALHVNGATRRTVPGIGDQAEEAAGKSASGNPKDFVVFRHGNAVAGVQVTTYNGASASDLARRMATALDLALLGPGSAQSSQSSSGG